MDPRLLLEWPAAGGSLWRIFNEMGRQFSGMGEPMPISSLEIDAWQRVHRRLTPWEIEMIGVFDALALETARKDKT